MIYDMYYLIQEKDMKVLFWGTEKDFFHELKCLYKSKTGEAIGNKRFKNVVFDMGCIIAKQCYR